MAAPSPRSFASKTWKDRVSKATSRGRLLMRVLSYSTQKSRIFLIISTFASVCAGATLPLMNILFARLVKTFNSQASSPSHVTSESFMSVISEYVVYIIYLFVGRLVLAYIAIFGFRLTSLSISAAIRLDYIQCLFRQPISTLDALPSGQTAAIITITANILQLGISERLSSLIQAIAVIIVALIIGCIYSWELTLVTACGLVLIVCWYSILIPVIVKKQTEAQQAERDAMNVAGEALLGVRMIAACGAESKTMTRYNKLVERAESMNKKLSPLLAIQHAPVFLTMFATFSLCFWYAVKLYVSLKFATVESLVVVLLSVMTMIAHLNAISVPLNAVSNAVDAAAIFFTIIDAPQPATTGIKGPAIALDKDLELRRINFAYPSRHDVRVLQNFGLTIPSGKTTAIVGPSGSGKSTVVALISRWYELGGGDNVSNYLRNGEIKIGSHDLSTIDLHWWRAQIGLVQQDPFLFNDTIFKNVEHGLVGTKHEHAASEVKLRLVQEACQDAFADEFIRKLPEGYDTPVGETGLKLSGGQRQRIAIARAVVRNPTILIFDEATSALDVTSERIVQAALAKASQGRTTIVIAHRLSTIRNADQIAVVAKGCVVQVGNHDNLLKDRDGAYWKLVNAQHLAAGMTKPAVEDFWDTRSSRGDSFLAEKESYDTLVELGPEIIDDDDKKILVQKVMDTTAGGCKPGSTVIEETTHSLTQERKKGVLGGFSMLLTEQRQNWIKYVIILVAAAGAGSTSSIQAYLFARLISGFAYWGPQLISSTSFLCIMLVVVAVGVGVSYFTLGWVANNASTYTVSFYRKEYFRNVITKPIGFFDDPEHSSGLLSARIATDPAQLQQLLGINMAMVVISLLNLTGCITIAIVFHWKFGLVIIVSSLPIILACGWYRVRHEVRFEARNNKIFAESARYATEAIRGVRTVASLTLERTVCHQYNSMLQAHISRSWKEARVSCAVFALSDSMVLLCMAFSLWYGGSLLAAGTLKSFNFLVVYLAIIQGSLAAGQWLSFGPNIAQVSAAASRIHAMRTDDNDNEARMVARHEERHRWTLPASLLWKGADIEFRNVHFKYPTRDVPVLRGCSLIIQHGQFAAIVGSSGAGKTSVISLIERFYAPQAGAIYFNGENIATIPASTLRKRMSLVAQEASIFHGTIRENILFGVDDTYISEAQLLAASRDAGIHDFVCSLPEAYDTNVGQSGVSLSGGQRQRIAIARALIRDPEILLLDEATSNLDSQTEREVQAVFERTGKGRTMVVVAHRLATVQHANIIFVMHEGRIVEKGDHKSLLAAKGRYWHMCEAQALSA